MLAQACTKLATLHDFDEEPDIADDVFLLASSLLHNCPALFVELPVLPALLDCATTGILVQHRCVLAAPRQQGTGLYGSGRLGCRVSVCVRAMHGCGGFLGEEQHGCVALAPCRKCTPSCAQGWSSACRVATPPRSQGRGRGRNPGRMRRYACGSVHSFLKHLFSALAPSSGLPSPPGSMGNQQRAALHRLLEPRAPGMLRSLAAGTVGALPSHALDQICGAVFAILQVGRPSALVPWARLRV